MVEESDVCHFHVGDSHIDRVISFIHLGHRINSVLNDRDDIWHRHCGQVNNALCYFPRIDSDIHYKLFRSYCSSIYGCELGHLNGSNTDTFCTAWRLALWLKACMEFAKYYSQWFTSYDQQWFGFFDELCRHSLMFIHQFFFHSSNPVKFVVRYGVLVGRYRSVIGSNFHFCVARFAFSQSAFLNGCVNIVSIVRNFCSLQIDNKHFGVVQFTWLSMYCVILLPRTVSVILYWQKMKLAVL